MTASDFVKLLTRSNLLSAEALGRVRRALSPENAQADPRVLARELIRREMLTLWQAQQLLAGCHTFFLGRYKLLERIGEGGMGTVFKAQQEPLGRIVALKVMAHRLLKDREAVVRFQREVQAVAALNHPHIVAAFDAGQVGATHFLVMEYVPGQNLNRWVQQFGPLPLDFAAETIRQAALGLYHAHSEGMVHRDIKPGNILVTACGVRDYPNVKVLDMGLARMVREFSDEEPTSTNQILGTPDYMAPEQVRSSRLVDPRSDIFSLGCTFFKIATGSVPFSGETPLERIMARTMEDAPPLREFRAPLPPGLNEVVGKMLARNPEHRWRNCLELAEELFPYSLTKEAAARWEAAGESVEDQTFVMNARGDVDVEAEADTTLNEFLDVLAAQAALEPAIIPADKIPADKIPAAKIPGEKPLANPARHQPGPKSPPPPRPTSLQKAAPQVRPTPLVRPPVPPRTERQPHFRPERQPPPAQPGLDAQSRLDAQPNDTIPAEPSWFPSWFPRGWREPSAPTAFQARLSAIAASIAATLLLAFGLVAWTQSWPPVVLVEWPLEARTDAKLEVDREQVPLDNQNPLRLTLAPGKHRLVAWRRGYEPYIWEAELPLGKTEHLTPKWTPAQVGGFPETPRPSTLPPLPEPPSASGAQGGSARTGRQELLQWEKRLDEAGKAGPAFAWQNLRTELLSWSQRTTIPQGTQTGLGWLSLVPSALDALAKRPQLAEDPPLDSSIPLVAFWKADARPRHWNRLTHLTFAPSGDALFTAGADQVVKRWDWPATKLAAAWPQSGPIRGFGLSPQGDLLAISAGEHGIRLLDPRSGVVVRNFDGLSSEVAALAFAPAGNELAAVGDDQSLWIWDLKSPDNEPRRFRSESRMFSLTAQGANTLATGTGLNTVILWDGQTGEPTQVLSGHSHRIVSLAVDPQGERLASGSLDHSIRLWHALTGTPQDVLTGQQTPVQALAFHPQAPLLASGGLSPGGSEGQILLWNLEQRSDPPARLAGSQGEVLALAFAPQGNILAAGDAAGSVRFWRLADEGPLPLGEPPFLPRAAVLAPDGASLILAGQNAAVQIHDLIQGKAVGGLFGQARRVGAVTLSADGRRMATSTPEHGLEVWDIATGLRLTRLGGHTSEVAALALSPDEKLLASASVEHELKIWDLKSGQQIASQKAHTGLITQLVFSANSATLASASRDGSVKTWDAATGQPKTSFWEHEAPVVGLAFHPSNKTLASCDERGQLCLWNVGTLKVELTLGAHLSGGPVAFSPDGLRLATAGGDGEVRIWDVRAGRSAQRYQLGPPGGRFRDLRFSVDGRYLLTLNGNHTCAVLRCEEPRWQEWTTARWILEQGGSGLIVSDRTHQTRPVFRVQQLPAEPFHLRQVALNQRPIDDAALQRLTSLPALLELYLSQSSVTNAGLRHLAASPQLHALGLSGTRISDAGLETIARLNDLRKLYLRGTPLSDAAIPYLKQLRKLAMLDIRDTQISPTGLAELRVALPSCRILE